MSKYSYQARNRSGELFTGEVEAPSRASAAMQVRQKGLWVTSIIGDDSASPAPNNDAIAESPLETLPKIKKVHLKEILRQLATKKPSFSQQVMLFRELAVLLSAGLPIHKAIEMLANGATGVYKDFLTNLHTQIMQGKPFSSALEQTGLFSASIVSLARAGETGGSLETLLATIADFEERRFATREKLKSSLLYPGFLLLATVIAFIVMMVFILPSFTIMLQNLDSELPLSTRFLLWISSALLSYPLPIVITVCVFIYIIICLWHIPKIRYKIDCVILWLPLYGTLINNSTWNTVCSTIAVLLENGIPLHEGIALAADGVANTYLTSKLLAMKLAIESGKTLHNALSICPEFPSSLGELILAGEESGTLEVMLARAAYFCNIRAQNAAARLEALAQPLAICFVAILVAIFVASIMQPILSSMDAFI